jgi:hypothetical protein
MKIWQNTQKNHLSLWNVVGPQKWWHVVTSKEGQNWHQNDQKDVTCQDREGTAPKWSKRCHLSTQRGDKNILIS